MNELKKQLEYGFSERLGRRVSLTSAAAGCLSELAEHMPVISWELLLLDRLLAAAPSVRKQCGLLVDFRYQDLLSVIEGANHYTDYDWPENAKYPRVEVVREGPDLRNSLLWQLRLPQPESIEDVLDLLLGQRPTGGVGVVYVDGAPIPVNEAMPQMVGLNDLLYLLFRTLYAGARISDTGIVLLLLSGRSQDDMHLGRCNRWFLDGFEGAYFETGDPPSDASMVV